MNRVDYDLHGLIGIRLLGASAGDAAAVDRQLGPIRAELSRSPDITVRFVERLSVREPLHLVGVDDAAFTSDCFLLLRSKHKTAARVQIPFDQVGGPCEIVCETGLAAVPLLIAIINLTALAKGVLPLHASAFVHNGVGVVATGWSKGGKTELLLAFMAQGATYVGDEWVYLAEGGEKVFGLPEPVTVWDWHLAQLPEFRAALSGTKRARLRAVRWLANSLNRLIPRDARRRASWARLLSRTIPLLQRHCCANVPPEALFGPRFSMQAGSLDLVVFAAGHDQPAVTVEKISPSQIARRMTHSLQEERALFLSYYRKYRFAFPDRTNPFVEQAEAVERELLLKLLQDCSAYAVRHPYPTSIQSLYEAVYPLLETTPERFAGADAAQSRGDEVLAHPLGADLPAA
ncbi:MAG: hypothetical protein KY475_23215 [Planctomycetes bacterium]|nr:hypothetical protein [Planctomycetota bacterium]